MWVDVVMDDDDYLFLLNYRITSSWCTSLTWRVAPGLIVRREDAEVAASDKVLIIHWK